MIDREKVERALEIADKFDECNIDIKRTTDLPSCGGRTHTIVSILVYGNYNHNPVDRVLEVVPKLRKYQMPNGEIWAKAAVDGIELTVSDVGKCEVVYKTVQVPETVATGKMVEKTVTEYVCPGDVQ